MKKIAPKEIVAISVLWIAVGLLAGCASDRPLRTPDVGEAIRAALPPATVAVPSSISNALAEPAPPVVPLFIEPKLDLLVNNAPAREVFLALVTDSRYSMLMHPDVAGSLSVTLRGVTVLETLEAIRDVYGYDFKMDGRRITVYAPTLQTRIFTINYPHAQRYGTSTLRVASGGLEASGGQQNNGSGTNGFNSGAGSAGGSGLQGENSLVYTTSRTDFWDELTNAVSSMLGDAVGRNVTVSPQAGIMVVRAMPDELRQVDKFLDAAQIAVERQVMLEAKIIEVELFDSFQNGIDWSAMRNGGSATGAIGVLGGNTTSNPLVSGVQSDLPGFTAGASMLENAIGLPSAGGGMFGLALATNGFKAALGFLETRGDVQTLSSPRIATLNNQKALLKVGTDEFFVTNVSGVMGTNNNNNNNNNNILNNNLPSLELTPFFSGISLDVTPQIDGNNNITLHVRPSVTAVAEKVKQVDLGEVGNFRLPLASSKVNEFDTMVRIQNGNIVAIGGLMQLESSRKSSGLPGSTSALLGNKVKTGRKRELVVLIKPTIIRSAQDWEEQNRRTRAALDDMDVARARVIRIDGTVEEDTPKDL
ncbi:MAG: MSHA biogenesis protein MshL [Porticoccus sp.]|jgi:MSHA biogenesis protein MshL